MNEHETPTARQLLRPLRRRAGLVVLVTAVATAVGAAIGLRPSVDYTASSTVLVGASRNAPVSGLTEPTTNLTPLTAAKLVRTREVAKHVNDALGSTSSPDALLAQVTTSATYGNDFVTITSHSASAASAAQIANAFAKQFIRWRMQDSLQQVRDMRRLVERDLSLAPKHGTEHNLLVDQLAQLRTATPLADVELVESAVPPANHSSHIARDTAAGLLIGLLLALGLVYGLEVFDPRLRSFDELDGLVSAPTLAAVPADAFKGRRRRFRPGREPSVLAISRKNQQPFERLRTSLLVFNGEDDLRTLLVTSPQHEKEGKTTVAANLALSIAKLGLRVCVVDTDFRRPRLGNQFGLGPDTTGLADVLQGTRLEDALVSFAVPGAVVNGYTNGYSNGNGKGHVPSHPLELTVLPAGRVLDSPAELVGSRAMQDILERLERDFDIVVADCAPVLEHTDALPLFARASGTLIVVRFGLTERDAAARAVQVVERARGRVLGVVGTGAGSRELREDAFGSWPTSRVPAT